MEITRVNTTEIATAEATATTEIKITAINATATADNEAKKVLSAMVAIRKEYKQGIEKIQTSGETPETKKLAGKILYHVKNEWTEFLEKCLRDYKKTGYNADSVKLEYHKFKMDTERAINTVYKIGFINELQAMKLYEIASMAIIRMSDAVYEKMLKQKPWYMD